MVAIKSSAQLKHEDEVVTYAISPWRKWFYISFAVIAYFLITVTMFHSHKLMSHHEREESHRSPGSLNLLTRGHGHGHPHGNHEPHSHHPHGHGHSHPHHHDSNNYAHSNDKQSNKDWDFLIFTQHWPNTVCLSWNEKTGRGCNFPADTNMWSIHGIWPTRTNTEGPFFCNKVHFNATLLEPIKDDLNKYWLDVEQGRPANDLWVHEWSKHGTCAMADPPLDTELKYFSQGLKWFEEYNMEKVLGKYQILPKVEEDSGVSVIDIWNAVTDSIGKKPVIRCLKDQKTAKTYLFEIRICFDKDLNNMDCDGAKGYHREHDFVYDDIHTNCPLHEPIFYTSVGNHQPSLNHEVSSKKDNSAISALKSVRSYIQGLFIEKDSENEVFTV